MADNPITTRNLIDADVGPLRRFTGVLDSMPTEERTYGEGESARATTRISLNYKEIEVLEALEPYHFPIFTISIGQSNRKKSRWGVFGTSLNEILDQQYTAEQLDPASPNYIKPSDRMDINDCLGKRMGLVLADGAEGRPAPPLLYDGRAEEDRLTPAWTTYMIEGLGVTGGQGKTPLDAAMEKLDGKTLADFNQAALADPLIRGDATLLQSISLPVSAPNSFANTMIASGQFTKDDQEIYHKVVGPAPTVTPPAA